MVSSSIPAGADKQDQGQTSLARDSRPQRRDSQRGTRRSRTRLKRVANGNEAQWTSRAREVRSRGVMDILGISAFYHDSAACLVRDGVVFAAAEEERFTRKKHDSAFPTHAVAYCLAEAGIDASGLELVVFYEKPLLKFDRLLETYLAYAPAGFKLARLGLPVWIRQRLHLPRELD